MKGIAHGSTVSFAGRNCGSGNLRLLCADQLEGYPRAPKSHPERLGRDCQFDHDFAFTTSPALYRRGHGCGRKFGGAGSVSLNRSAIYALNGRTANIGPERDVIRCDNCGPHIIDAIRPSVDDKKTNDLIGGRTAFIDRAANSICDHGKFSHLLPCRARHKANKSGDSSHADDVLQPTKNIRPIRHDFPQRHFLAEVYSGRDVEAKRIHTPTQTGQAA